MTVDDVDALIRAAQQRVIASYLERQELEQARQQLNARITRCEMALVASDGELSALALVRAHVEKG